MRELWCKSAELEDKQDILELGCGWGSLTCFMAQKFPNSNQWEYYVVNTHFNDKVPLEIPGNKEISNGDIIGLPWLDQSKGKFEVWIFDYDVPRFNRYI